MTRSIFLAAAVCCLQAAAGNLLTDGEIEAKTVPDDCRLLPDGTEATLVVAERDDGLRFSVRMPGAKPDMPQKGDVWTGDSAELFVCRHGTKGDPLHYVVGPDGSSWAAETNPAEATCALSSALKDETTWQATFDLSWQALGFASHPPQGTPIRFLVLRNTKSVNRGRSSDAQSSYVSCFGFVGKEAFDVSRYSVLYVGRPEGLSAGADPSDFLRAGEESKEAARLAKLNAQKLIIAQLPVTLDPTVPFVPDELMAPSAKFDGASAVPVPPKEAGLLWVDIDCTGLEPGVYRGELVVTPLCSGTMGKIDRMTVGGVVNCPIVRDDSTVLPVELEVLPFAIDLADMGFCGYIAPNSAAEVDLLNELGGVANLVSPYGFKFTCDADGHITERNIVPTIRRMLYQLRDRMNRLGDLPRVMVGYSWYGVFRLHHAKANKLVSGSEAYWRAYREWTQYLDDEMKKAGFGYDDYVVEVIDEPIQPADKNGAGWHAEAVESYRQAKLAVPQMRLAVTEGEKEYFEDLFPYVDLWIFKYFGYQDPTFRAYTKRMRDAGKLVSMYACYTSPRQVADQVHEQELRLSMVFYSDFNGFKPEYRNRLRMCDEVSVWFWEYKNIDTMVENVKRTRDFIGTERDLLLGLYMWDFAGGGPISGTLMEKQLEYARKYLADRTIDGLVFHPTFVAGLDLDAVKVSKVWIADHADRPWGV